MRLIIIACLNMSIVDADYILFLQDPKKINNNPTQNSIDNTKKTPTPTSNNTIDTINTQGIKKDSNSSSPKEYTLPKDMTAQEDISPSTEGLAINDTKNTTGTYNVANGSVFIAISNKGDKSILKIGSKVIPWIPHPTDSTKQIAYVPVGYYAKKGKLKLSNNIMLNIIEGSYRKENITITNTSKVKPSKEQSERIERELKEANIIYSNYTNKRYWNQSFVYPIQSVITSPFGSARIFNGEIKSYHSGTDFRVAIGTPIKVANDGVVVIAKDRLIAGKSVVISHGEGLFSMYYHCSKINVRVGDKVKRGDIIALSGDTGRVSGAHLHFGILVNGVQVDPLKFLDSINKLFDGVKS